MIVFGINDTHDTPACLIEDGKLIIVVEAKSFKRVKKISNFQEEGIKNK
jgi:predicted NodU family carbamoyl transferase|tara:strand:- start:69 stop:215 length:147 start_codon:yes stop_codon:yes gene_type:complete